MHQEFTDKISNKSALIGIIGIGYVGLPLMLRFAEMGYRCIGIGFEGPVGLYLCNSASVPESVHHLCESDAIRRPGVYAYMRPAQTPPEEVGAFFSCEIVYRYLQSLLAVLKVGEKIGAMRD